MWCLIVLYSPLPSAHIIVQVIVLLSIDLEVNSVLKLRVQVSQLSNIWHHQSFRSYPLPHRRDGSLSPF